MNMPLENVLRRPHRNRARHHADGRRDRCAAKSAARAIDTKAARSVGPLHAKQLFRANVKIVRRATAAQDVAGAGGVVHTVFEQPLVDVHGHHFAQHQPGRHGHAVDALQLKRLRVAALKTDRCMEKLRERGKRSDIPEEDWDKYLEQTPASPEDRLVLEQCLRALDDSERQVVILHAVGGMKHRETAELLGLPLATVLSKYSRAIKKLKSKLEKREGI